MGSQPVFYAPGNSYNPGDWPQTLEQQAANETAFSTQTAQELSSAVQVSEARQALLGLSGDDRTWSKEVPAIKVGAPSMLTPDIQGNQEKNPYPATTVVPYIGNHLFP